MANKKKNCSACLLGSKSTKTSRGGNKRILENKIPDNKETAVITLDANRANAAIQAILSI